MFEFHISRAARDRYGVAEVLFSFNGNAIFANPGASRALAHRINQVRGAQNDPARQVQPAALFAMGLIDEAAHAVLAHYRTTVAPGFIRNALEHFSEQVGKAALDKLLLFFVEAFPGTAVYNGEQTPAEWLAGETDSIPHREAAFEEIMLLWFENRNPSFAPFRELFDETQLAATTVYPDVAAGLPAYFEALPELGAGRGGLFELLRSVLSTPGSLTDQLALLRGRWGFAVEDLLRRVLLAGDVLKEEEVALWQRFNAPTAEAALSRRNRSEPGGGGGHAEVPTFTTAPAEYEHFSPDQEWMPRTVMIAKSTYVWLNQLSRFYGREVQRLDQIPSEELQALAARGMNALWLIGVWERSRASQTIKRLCGNADAVASAYSLYDYAIAENLGGEAAYRDLRDRCARYGIRLASDMVPNHMGIDSTWVIEHPEWFLSRHDSPYPAYTFQGPDLSGDDRIEIKIEDHYYEQTDAAVVFLRRDKWTGDTQYIYHGNDGTSFPWNDTAQLNYLSAAVREQVIQTILQVARQFPIIRFDAAMTLAKRHVQRLWFPAPGAGGSIPSRAESAMTTSDFDAALPEEFWREVVDRVAREVPGTLLLAEAFWLMEGYFVRTLGMHRVYNSAFMVMLRDEDNANYRKVLKNTLEFDPGIMKRYVNFMSNPDERTAIDQFGSGDKFFGVTTMMATLPGLPMFGHGQVEGFTEKYGMEYYRPRFEEWPDESLAARHTREIAPLLHNRQLFAESDNFLLYDLWAENGGVEENVFAYSNQRDGQRALIVYNNSYGSACGMLHQSAAYMDKAAGQLRQRSLADALNLPTGDDAILGYRNSATGLHHLRRASEVAERGLAIDLRAYQYMTLLDWRELRSDASHDWHRLCDLLGGRGVEDLDRALLSLELEPLHQALRAALDPRLVREVASLAARTAATVEEDAALLPHSELLEEWLVRATTFVELARMEYLKRIQPPPPVEPKAPGEDEPELLEAEASNEESLTETHLRERMRALLRLPLAEEAFAVAWPRAARTVLPSASPLTNAGSVWSPVLAYTLVAAFAASLDPVDPRKPAVLAFDQLALRGVLAASFAAVEFQGQDTWRSAARVRLALQIAPRAILVAAQHGLASEAWQEGDLRWLAGVNEHEGRTYFNQESLEQLLWWHALPGLLYIAGEPELDATALQTISDNIDEALAGAAKAGYRLDEAPAASDPSAGTAEPPFAEHIEAHLKDAPALPLDSAVEPLEEARPEALVKGAPEPEIASKIAKLQQEASAGPKLDLFVGAATKKPEASPQDAAATSTAKPAVEQKAALTAASPATASVTAPVTASEIATEIATAPPAAVGPVAKRPAAPAKPKAPKK